MSLKFIQRYFFPLFLTLTLILVDPFSMDMSLASKKIVLGFTLLIGSLFIGLTRKNHLQISGPNPTLVRIYLLFILFRGISVFYGRNFSESWFDFSRDIETFLLLMLLVSVYPSRDVFLSRFALTFLTFIALVSAIGWLQVAQIYLDGKILSKDTYYVKSLFSHRNMFAQILVFSLPFSIYYSAKRSLLQIPAVLSILSSLSLIMLLFCRSAWISAGTSILVTGMIFIIRKSPSIKKWIGMGGAVLLLALLFYPIKSLMNQDDIGNQLHTFTNWDYGSAQKRLEIWEGTFGLIGEKPFFGHGLGDWKIEINRFIGSKEVTEDGHTFYQRPHNDFLWIWSESGLPAMLLYMALFVFIFYKAWLNLKSNISFVNPAFIGVFGLTSYLIIALMSFPMERIEHQVFLGLFFFLAFPESENKPFKRGFYFFFSVLIICFLFADISRLIGDRNTKKALLEKDAQHWALLSERIDAARNLFHLLDGTSTPLIWYKGLANMNERNFNQALTDFQQAKKENPYHIHVLNSLGSIYFAQNLLDSADANYQALLKINPQFNDALVNSAVIRFNQKNLESSLARLSGINPEKLNERQEAVIYRILNTKLALMLEMETDVNRKSVLHRMMISQTWSLDLFVKSIQEERTFELQVQKDVSFILKNNDLPSN